MVQGIATNRAPSSDGLAAERLMMLQPRGEAPVISSPHLDEGELLFCFIGQVSSRAGTPLIVDPHAVSFQKGGKYQLKPLREALESVKFEQLVNTGKTGNLFDGVVETEESNQQIELDGSETSQAQHPSSVNALTQLSASWLKVLSVLPSPKACVIWNRCVMKGNNSFYPALKKRKKRLRSLV